MNCPYCVGGSIAVEPGSSQRYRCPDCGGTGVRNMPEDDKPMQHSTLPTYPMRPISGGPFRSVRPGYVYEPKYNGWRALVHIPTGAMFNRHGQALSIEKEFKPALDAMRTTLDAQAFKWADCEALERRHNIGRGCLIVLDVIVPVYPYKDRRAWLEAVLPTLPVRVSEVPLLSIPPHVDPTTAWTELQGINRRLGAEFYEGVVGKRLDFPYEIQLRSDEQTTTGWIKHRWRF